MKSSRTCGMRLGLVAVTVGLWTTSLLGQEGIDLNFEGEAVVCIAFAPDGKTLVSVSCDLVKEFRGAKPFYIQTWDVKTGKEKRALMRRAFVYSIAFSPDGRTLAAGCFDFLSDEEEGTIKLWDTKTFQEKRTLKGHTDTIDCVAFSPDGKIIASGGKDGTIKLWDATTGNELRTLKVPNTNVWSVKFSPDGKTLASCGENEQTKLWDVRTGNEEWSHKGWGPHLVFSPDGETFALTNYDTIKLLDATTRKVNLSLKGRNHREISHMAFFPDGKTMASIGYDVDEVTEQYKATMKLWNTQTGREIRTLIVPTLPFHAIVFSPNAKTLALNSHDKTITLWDIPNIP